MFLTGVIHALNVPGFGLFFTMVGFSTLAKAAGFDLWLSLATTISVWGMPGQVALVSLYATGSSLTIIFIAVSLANMRMMLMIISGYQILQFNLHNIAFWKKVFLLHIMAVTSWAQLSYVKDRFPAHLLLHYYIGFSITIYSFGLSGTFLGYFIDNFVNYEMLQAIAFMTPLYILLLVISSPQTINRLSVALGGLLVPLIFPIFSEWSILIGGFLGGSLAFGLGSMTKL